MDHTAQRVLSLVPRFLSGTVRDFFYSVSIVFFFIEVVSIAIQSRISEDVKCKNGQRGSCILSCCTSGVR